MNDNMVSKPNLFNYATKELSQDAFLCWLIEWADTKYKGEKLHDVGTVFLKSLLAKVNVEYNKLTSIEIKMQWEKIDALILLELDNRKVALIIEDKIHTTDHGNQLERYKELVEKKLKNDEPKDYKLKDYELKCIYFKTGDSANHKGAENAGYGVYLRQDFLEAVKDYKDIDSDIFQDFYKTMAMWEVRISEFKTKVLSEWDNRDFIGLFIDLSKGVLKDKKDLDWGYFSGRSGYLKCRWGYININMKENDFQFFLQIHSNGKIISFRTYEIDSTENMRLIHDDFIKFANDNGCPEVVKPKMLKFGNTCAIAIVKCKNWLGNDTDTYNAEFVAKNLEKYIKLHADFIEYYKNK